MEWRENLFVSDVFHSKHHVVVGLGAPVLAVITPSLLGWDMYGPLNVHV